MNNTIQTIELLYGKYESNPYIIHKLETYVCNLPKVLENIDFEHKKKCIKTIEIDKEKEEFIQLFLSSHSYYYIPQTEIYIEYINNHYHIISEDDIVHSIIGQLNANKLLSNCKYRLTNHVMKLIRKNYFIHSTPSNYTIQVLLIYLSKYFATKQHVKYFLTIIGDFILSKKDNLIFFIDSSYKQLITSIYQHIYLNLNKSILDLFKHKYYDHKYEHSRIIYGSTVKTVDDYFIKDNIFNIIAVCTHYSKYYTGSESFLENCSNREFSNKVNYLKIHSSVSLINAFIEECLFKTTNDHIMLYKDMYFLWKTFLKTNHLPFVISKQNFKHILQEMNIYDEYSDKCIGYTSKNTTYWKMMGYKNNTN